MAEKRISLIIAVMIFILTAINGIFTYSGALLYIGEMVYALLFAIAVQFAISISLIALPYVRGLGKPVLIMVYIGATLLSTLSAYTFIYNSGRDSQEKAREITAPQVSRVIQATALVASRENQLLDQKFTQLQRLQREVEEEGSLGLRSGKGAGKGKIYYQKLEKLKGAEVAFNLLKQKNQKLNSLIKQTDEKIQQGKREKLQLHLAHIQQYTSIADNFALLEKVKEEALNETQNPIQVALMSLSNYSQDNIQLLVSIIWAAVFDLIALFLGIVRYYIVRPDYSLLGALYQGVLNFYLFFARIRYAAKEAQLKHKQEVKVASMKTPYNSAEIQNFASYLIAGANYAQKDKESSKNPVAYLLQHI